MSVRILVTGSTGFIGRAALPALRSTGASLAVTIRGATALTDVHVIDAGRTPDEVVARVRDFAPDVVLHLATNFIAGHRPDEIPELVDANVTFGTLIAEAAAQARFVTIGSAWEHFEGHEYDPVSLYAATKRAFADVLGYFEAVRGLRVHEVVLFDTYGPGDVRAKLIPSLMRAAATGTALEMSDGEQLIDLTYVDDIVRGLVSVVLDEHAPSSSVLRSGAPLRIRDLVDTAASAIERSIPVIWDARPSRPREMRTDWQFGAPLPGWQPQVSLIDGLRTTWDAFTAGDA